MQNDAFPCLRIMQWNVRGMNDLAKFDSILQTLDACKTIIDVVVIGETWLTKENSKIYKIPGYESWFSCRNESNGGLAIFVSSNITSSVVKNVYINGLHHIHVQIKLNGHAYDLHGIYRPPSYDFAEFHVFLENILANTCQSRPCFIVGDVNVPINNSNNNVVVKYKTLLESYGFICSNTFTTRPVSENILDHCICKIDDTAR